MPRRVLLPLVLLTLACESQPQPEPQPSGSIDAPTTKPPPPPTVMAARLEPDALVWGDQRIELRLTDQRLLRPSSEVALDAVTKAWREALKADPSRAPIIIEVDPLVTMELLLHVGWQVDRKADAPVSWRDLGASEGLDAQFAPGVVPDDHAHAQAKACRETVVVLARVSHAVSIEDRPEAPRPVEPSGDPWADIAARIDARDLDSCRKHYHHPAVLWEPRLRDDIAALTDGVAACPHIRVGLAPALTWALAGPALKQLSELDARELWLDHGRFDCGAGLLADGPARALRIPFGTKRGPLQEYAIIETAQRHQDQTEACLAKAPRDQSWPEWDDVEALAKHRVDLEIGPGGKVTRAAPVDPEDPVATCLAEATRGWTFDDPPGGATVAVAVEYDTPNRSEALPL